MIRILGPGPAHRAGGYRTLELLADPAGKSVLTAKAAKVYAKLAERVSDDPH